MHLSGALGIDFSKASNCRIVNGPDPEWVVGDGGVVAEQLVLVSLRRISVGSWVPCVRLSYGPKLVPFT